MVLVVSLLVMAVLAVLGTAAVMTTTTDLKITSNYTQNKKAFYNADAGVERVIAYLRANTVNYPTGNTPTTISVSCPTGFNFNTSVNLNYVSSNTYKFQMTGTGANNVSKTIETHIRKVPLYPQEADGAVAMYGGGPEVAFKTGGGGG
jgi:Tfp pilus assembly protein PilX